MSNSNNGPDTNDTQLLEAAGLTFRFRPASEQAQNVPVLLIMHGYGANDGDAYELVPLVERQVAIVSVRGPGNYSDDPRGSFKWYDMDLNTCTAEPHAPDQSLQQLLDFMPAFPGSAGLTVAPDQFFVGGFSQGAVMSLALVAARPALFAGAIIHSCPFSEELAERLQAADLTGKPFFVAHGLHDFLPIEANGRALVALLQQSGADVTYHEYDFGHETSLQSRQDLADWLAHHLNQQ